MSFKKAITEYTQRVPNGWYLRDSNQKMTKRRELSLCRQMHTRTDTLCAPVLACSPVTQIINLMMQASQVRRVVQARSLSLLECLKAQTLQVLLQVLALPQRAIVDPVP